MTRLTLHGAPVYTEGSLPPLGRRLPRLELCGRDLLEHPLDALPAVPTVLHVLPSLELPSCQAAHRAVWAAVAAQPGWQMVAISADLPFALARLAAADDARLHLRSCFRHPGWARSLGLDLVSGPLKGLPAQGLFVLDARHRLRASELVRELSELPQLGLLQRAAEAQVLPAGARPHRPAAGRCDATRATVVASTDVASVAA